MTPSSATSLKVEVQGGDGIDIFMMFDPGHTLAERILSEQFGYLKSDST